MVSNNAYNQARPDLVIMAITSQLRSLSGFGEVQIANWQAASLLKPSAIKPVFATVEQTLILKTLGALQDVDRLSLQRAIAGLLG